MRYLITGGTGFIGSHLCKLLAERGGSLVALVRNPARASGLPPGTEILAGDLSLFARADVELPEVDVIVHLAGVVAADSPEQYEAINYSAVKDLVDCIERQSWKPRRLLFASSLAAAGPSALGQPWTEHDPLSPIEPYGDAKGLSKNKFVVKLTLRSRRILISGWIKRSGRKRSGRITSESRAR